MILLRCKHLLAIFILVITIILVSFKSPAGGTVRGTVTPPEKGLHAFLFSGKDTLSANVVSGAFQFSNVAAAGNYKLLVEAAPPYQNAVKDGVRVSDGEYSDAGQIELQK